MQADFIEGFVKAAIDRGLTDKSIARIFKLAMGSPGASQMFNQLPAGGAAPQGAPAAPTPPGGAPTGTSGPPQQQASNGQPNPQLMQMLSQQSPQQLSLIQQMLSQQSAGQAPQGGNGTTQPIQ